MTRAWVEPEIRDEIVRFVDSHASRAGLAVARLIAFVGISRERFYQWRQRCGQPNEHNAALPRKHWLMDWEKRAILDYHDEHPSAGYRRLTYMMLDENIVAVSPSSTYRTLKEAGAMRRWNGGESKKGTGFVQPLSPHKHWHVDVSYVNVCGTFYYFCSLLDGFSRYITHWEIREAMKESDIEIIIERARKKFPSARPRIISDNGPQFLSRDFREFIRLAGMTHVRTSPYYPQSNGKIERFHQSLKRECIRPKTPLSLDDARRVVGEFVAHYNEERLHSAIGFIAPRDRLEGRAETIFAERRRKLVKAREHRRAACARREEAMATKRSNHDSKGGPTLLTQAG